MMHPDTIDSKIIRSLQLNGRITNVELARKVGLSPSACLRRLNQLENSGVIQGYVAIIGEKYSDSKSAVFVHCTLERQTADSFSRFEAAIRKCPDVAECYLMSGDADYVLRVEVRNTADYERVHQEQLSKLPGLARIQSSFAIRQIIKSRF